MTNRRVGVDGARCRGTFEADMVGMEGRKQDEQEQKKGAGE